LLGPGCGVCVLYRPVVLTLQYYFVKPTLFFTPVFVKLAVSGQVPGRVECAGAVPVVAGLGVAFSFKKMIQSDL